MCNDMQKSLVDLIRANIFYLVLITLGFIGVVSSIVTGTFAVFYFVIVIILLADEICQMIVLRILHRRFPLFFRRGVFWRVGVPTQFTRFFLSLGIMGLLGFKEQFGVTLQNLNESFLLILLVGIPFIALFSVGAFVFVKSSQSGSPDASTPSLDWIKTRSDKIGTIAYTFTMNGLGEEMLFRGLIQGYISMNMIGLVLLGSFPLLYSTILASLIFIIIHFYTMGETKEQSLVMLPYRIILTFILAITFQLTGSLLAPIIIHNVSNGFLVLATIRATKS